MTYFIKNINKLIFQKNITISHINEFDYIKSMAASSDALFPKELKTPVKHFFSRKA